MVGCVGYDDVVVEAAADVAVGAVYVEGNMVVGPAEPAGEDKQVGPLAGEQQG